MLDQVLNVTCRSIRLHQNLNSSYYNGISICVDVIESVTIQALEMGRASLAFDQVRSNNYVYLAIESSYSCQLCESSGKNELEERQLPS